MTTVLNTEPNLPPFFTAIDETETAFHCDQPVCEDSLQFLCMRWAAGSPECRGQGRCELQAASE
jgi:hypothetical protein